MRLHRRSAVAEIAEPSLRRWLSRASLLFCLASATTSSITEDHQPPKDALDCAMRRLFLVAARRAVPWRSDGMSDVYDALELSERCGDSYEGTVSAKTSSKGGEFFDHDGGGRDDVNDGVTFHVCPRFGTDDGIGTIDRPFRTIRRAILEARKASPVAENDEYRAAQRRNILLRAGIHFLTETLVLTPEDSYLAIRSFPGDRVWISGGIHVESATAGWKPASTGNVAMMANVSSIFGPEMKGRPLATGLFTVDPHRRLTLARYPNADVEVWNAPDRYLSSEDVFEWTLPTTGKTPDMVTIDLSQPNNPTGYLKNDSTMENYNKFGTGVGGACSSVWGDRPSYWCSNVSAGGWAEVDKNAALSGRMNIPRGVVLKDGTDIANRTMKWSPKGSRGAIVHVSHTQGWAWHMLNVSSVRTDKEKEMANIQFDKGGWQGGRNWQCHNSEGRLSDCDGANKTLAGGGWYIEGVLEELDAPGEFYYDTDNMLLYFYPPNHTSLLESGNESDVLLDGGRGSSPAFTSKLKRRSLGSSTAQSKIPDLIATNLQTLIKIEGTKENPVRGVQLLGVGFRDAAKTYMEQWSAPSGGDWALHRGGAIHIEGAEDVVISGCDFQRLDGNAVMLSGYCRGTRVTDSEFAWIGNGAIATWGDTAYDGYDATGGEQPRQSVVEGNVMSNLGLYQKQSSGWGQNKACENAIRNNVMFNLPRAAINFNDGLGGDNVVEGNVIFNACRESGDHGPINSWDRMPFLANTTSSPIPSFQPAPTHTFKNLILANYGASQGFDNDDGSSFYHTHDNVFYSADGFKMDYGGHDSVFSNNLVYGDECFGTGRFLPGHSDRFYNNTCIIAGGPKDGKHNVGYLFQCSADGLLLYNNSYYTADGNATWTCAGVGTYTLEQIQQQGMEAGTTVGATPDAETIVSWAKDILDMD